MEARKANLVSQRLKSATVGERIRYIRMTLGLTQDQVAEKASLSKSFLSEIENNKTNVSGNKLLRIADVLGASLDFLMRGVSPREFAEPRSIKIPAPLAEIAEEHGLSYKSVITLLEAHHSFIARRSPERSKEWTKNDWEVFYNNVKNYL